MEKPFQERPPVAARIGFYPLERNYLLYQLNQLFSSAFKMEVEGEIRILVVPHAGYPYSGKVAATAFRLIQGKEIPLVILVGPAHRAFVKGAAVDHVDYYLTPLGRVKVNKEVAQELVDSGSFIYFDSTAHAQEHSIEVQLPFLQLTLGNFEILPVLIGDYSPTYVSDLAGVMVKVMSKYKSILIASSDFSHYYPYEVAKKMDLKALELIKNFDQPTLYKKLSAGEVELCGAGAVLVAMDIAKELGVKRVTLLKYLNSGDVTGDRSSVVGYAAICFSSQNLDSDRSSKLKSEKWLSKEAERELLSIARQTLKAYFETGETPKFNVKNKVLKKNFGAFVTLRKGLKLRGCIGQIEAVEPLHKVVSKMALASALNDPRFPPLTSDELEEVKIEISVLSPFKRVSSIEEIEVGRDGLFVCRGPWSGLLLPQVASEYGWNREEFLQQTCLKAGLEANAWKRKDCEIYRFSAQIFSEESK